MAARSRARSAALCALMSCLPVLAVAHELPLSDGGVPTTPDIVAPALLEQVEPEYPEEARKAGIGGAVTMEVTIAPDGTASDVRVIRAAGFGFDEAAVAAVKRFKFRPAMHDGAPVTATVLFEQKFAIQSSISATVEAQAPAGPVAPDAGGELSAAPRRSNFETVVSGQGPTSAASADSIADRDLQQRIIRTPEDILRAVPGLVLAQHQGGGKADQYFMRGFDADHGTDIAFYLDGIPINLPSNGHGQGYSDMHFLLPETIDRLEISKGPYFARYGDFDTAGAVELHTRRDFPESELQAAYGQFNTYRVAGVGSTGSDANPGWLAGEVYGTNGPFQSPEGLQRYNVMGKQTLQLTEHTSLTLLAMAYGSEWSASGLIPTRAVQDGSVDRFGSIDPTEGGSTQRQMIAATLKNTPSQEQELDLSVYATRYKLRLFNDFTFFLTDPVNGDEIEQDDDRVYTGIDARYRRRLRWQGMVFTTTLGGGGRFDATDVALYHVDSQHDRLPTCYGMPLFCDNADIKQSNVWLFAEEDARLASWLRVVAGVRGDLFEWNVNDLRTQPLPGQPFPTTGVVQQSLPSPKLAVVITPARFWDIYLDGGGGFHSNDARGVIATHGQGALARAWGGEVGSRVNLWNRVDLAAALWYLRLGSEVTFDPDVDTVGSNPPSERYGVDFSARWAIYEKVLWADADVTLAHATYAVNPDDGNLIALAPRETATAGVTAMTPFGLRGRIGLRQIGPRPATTDGTLTVPGYAVFDVTAAYRWRFLEVSASVENVFDTHWEEAAFAYVSRLPGEPQGGIYDIDFTPGYPINLSAAVTLYF
jgi:TonB family protein